MAKKFITEIMKDIQDNRENVELYKTNTTLKAVFEYTYNPEKKWLLPEGDAPYKPAPEPLGMTPTNFLQMVRMWHHFANPALTSMKREQLYINLLEGVHADEAKLLVAIKDGTVKKLYPFATKKFAQQHGFIETTTKEKSNGSEA